MGLGAIAAVPGFLIGFKAKPFVASLISLIGQGVIWYLLLLGSFNSAGWVIALGFALGVIYVLNLVNVVWMRIQRRPFPWLFMRISMFLAAGLIFLFLIQIGPKEFNLEYWKISLWVAVLPPLLQAISVTNEPAPPKQSLEPAQEPVS